MTDRTNYLTVVLEKEMREDDVQEVINAILMVKGVLTASLNVSDPQEFMEMSRVKNELRMKIWKLLED